jgi:serine/threonine protein kinase
LLGYGGSSAVFLARSLTSGDEVAVKVFLPRSTLDGAMRRSFYQRFLREAEAASQVEHPHILSIYAYGEHEGLPYIVMPYMSGGTLSEYVQQHGPLSLDEARRYLTQVASALDYAHTEGYVHCDVKPANILLDGQGHAALSDFGIVRWQQAEQPEVDSAKRSGAETLMGTPDYVSPEQALGESLDGRSDIYSLGATLYALLTGAPPFKADTPIALALMHVHEAPTPVGLLRADVTPQIDFVIAKALAKWPEERFQTAGAFALAFGLAVSEAGESAQFSLKHVRLAKLEVANPRTSVPLTVLTTSAEPVVQIKPISPTQNRFSFWRGGLLLTLVALLLLGCLLTALFIGALNATHSRVVGTTPTTSFPHGPLDDTENWPQSSTFFFRRHTYVIQNVAPQGGPALAFYANHVYTNFRLQVTTEEIKGTFNGADYYGVAFRASTDQSRYYLFDVSAWGGGLYDFLRYDGGDHWTTLIDGQIPLFQAAGRQNTLTVVVRDAVFLLYINGRQVSQIVVDHSSKIRFSGEIGLVVEEPRTEVAFSGLLLTTL